jgi:hypothetical protein
MSEKVTFDDLTIQRIFGHEAAEQEDIKRLRQYYFKSQVYDRMTSPLPLRILVGHKGIGKSALFKVAMQENCEDDSLAIFVKPDDIVEVESSPDDFLQEIRNWKSGLIRIIEDKALRSLGIRDESRKDHFSRAGKVVQSIVEIARPSLDKIVDIEAARRQSLRAFVEREQIFVYVDDLDRGWKADKYGIARLSALLNAIRDLSTDNPGLFFRIALRSDVYYLVRTSDESTDKIEGSVVWYSWTNHEILAMLVKRIESYFGRTRTERELMDMKQRDLAYFLNQVMVERFEGLGHWENCPTYRVIMSLIRKRPRDLVKLCTLAAQRAHDYRRSTIDTNDLESSFEPYSQGRLQDTANEFKSELPDIERLLLNMKPNRKERMAKLGYVYTTETLLDKIKNIQEGGQFLFTKGGAASPKQLAHFMYKINFITARKELSTGLIQRKYFEENRYLSSEFADFGFDWEIHPAFRWALQPDDPRQIYSSLGLSDDDERN